jgi:alkylhydroperoxidase/carboxymuconolactone decarboxylase family protein YurZ
MSHGKAVREELQVPTRQLRHAIPQVYAGYKQLHDSALDAGALDARTKELIALPAVGSSWQKERWTSAVTAGCGRPQRCLRR